MFFGMKNSPAHFQKFIKHIMAPLGDNVKAYIDDILIAAGETLEEHRYWVKRTLQILQKYDLYCKAEKCYFNQTKVDYLGMKVSRDGIDMDPDKVKAIMEWPPCENIRGIRKFLGFCGFYREFIPNYSHIVKPLTAKLQKDVKWSWGTEEQQAMNKLKEAFTKGKVLVHPDITKPFILKTDASIYAIGAVLEQ